MKIYLVTHETYDGGTHTDGIFSTRENAFRFAKEMRRREERSYDVSESRLDAGLDVVPPLTQDHTIGPVYTIEINLGSGSAHWESTQEDIRHPEDCEIEHSPQSLYAHAKSPISHDHAREHARRFITQFIAEQNEMLRGLATELHERYGRSLEVATTNTNNPLMHGWTTEIAVKPGRTILISWRYQADFKIKVGSLSSTTQNPEEVLKVVANLV